MFTSLMFTALVFTAPVQAKGQDIFDLSLSELAQVEVSIATGNATPIERAPATASVVTASDIRRMGARTLDDIVASLPGIHVSLSSLSRLDTVYSIRGIHTGFNPHVLLLLNGVPVQSSLQSGRPTLLRMPVTGIERVEVIRGPGSAIYGADAYAGVINVITRDASNPQTGQLGGRAGSFGVRDLWAEHSWQWQDVGIAWSGAYMASDGDEGRIVARDLQTVIDNLFGTQASYAPGSLATNYEVFDSRITVNSEAWKANLWYWASRDAGLGAGGAQALDPVGREDSDIFLADISYQFNTNPNGWDNRLDANYIKYKQDVMFVLFPPGSVLPLGQDGNINFAGDRSLLFEDGVIGQPGGGADEGKLDWVGTYNGWAGHRLRVALGWRGLRLNTHERKNYGPGVLEPASGGQTLAPDIGSVSITNAQLVDVSGTDYVFLQERSRHIRYLSLQDEWQLIPGLELTAGMRYDDYSDFGSTTNPRLALVWSANQKITTKLLYGSAFRAPSFSELGYKNNPVSLGNSELKPEQIDTFEFSLSYRNSSQLFNQITLYNYLAKDMIEFAQDVGTPTKTARNIRNQRGKGVEWELQWHPAANWQLAASYAWQEAEDRDTGWTIPNAPGRLFKLGSQWEFSPRWFLQGQWRYVADRARAQDDVRPAMANYSLVDINLRRDQLLPNIDLAIALRNTLDADAREPSSGEIPNDYPLEGRSAWLELTYRWQ